MKRYRAAVSSMSCLNQVLIATKAEYKDPTTWACQTNMAAKTNDKQDGGHSPGCQILGGHKLNLILRFFGLYFCF